ncbi:MAG: DUF4235 domain-containing protein [Euzebya sp.]
MAQNTTFMTQQLPRLAGIVGAIGVRAAISRAYRSRHSSSPPVDPSTAGVGWAQAIKWTAAMAVGAAVGRLVATYAAGQQVHDRDHGQRRLHVVK